MHHTYWKVLVVLQGEGTLRVDGRDTPCRPSDVLVIPNGQSHELRDAPGQPMALLAVCIARRLLSAEPGLAERIPTGNVALGPGVVRSVMTDLRTLLYEQAARTSGGDRLPGVALTMTAIAQRLMVRLARQAAATDTPAARYADTRERVTRYARRLERRFFAAPPIDDVAALLGISRRSLTSHFRAATGTTYLRFLRRCRIDHACRLLRDTDRTVVAIAFECGYDNLSTFYRAFQCERGCSPGEVRTVHDD